MAREHAGNGWFLTGELRNASMTNAHARIGALAGKLAATAMEQSGWLAAERSAQALLRKIAICIGWEPGLVPGVRPVLVVQY